jgi:plastocyanin
MASRLAFLLPACAAFVAPVAVAASIEAQVQDAAGKPVADAVVYATPAGGPQEARAAKAVDVAQADREFVPYVSVIQTGTSVAFPNRDPMQHHVYSFSPAKSFEIKLYTGRSPGEVRFDKPGIVTLGCNIHDWMIAYILVVSTPYFARTDELGRAQLRDLPAGAYELRAWHPGQRKAAAPSAVVLEAQAHQPAAYVIDVAPRKTRYKPPLDRLKY